MIFVLFKLLHFKAFLWDLPNQFFSFLNEDIRFLFFFQRNFSLLTFFIHLWEESAVIERHQRKFLVKQGFFQFFMSQVEVYILIGYYRRHYKPNSVSPFFLFLVLVDLGFQVSRKILQIYFWLFLVLFFELGNCIEYRRYPYPIQIFKVIDSSMGCHLCIIVYVSHQLRLLLIMLYKLRFLLVVYRLPRPLWMRFIHV